MAWQWKPDGVLECLGRNVVATTVYQFVTFKMSIMLRLNARVPGAGGDMKALMSLDGSRVAHKTISSDQSR